MKGIDYSMRYVYCIYAVLIVLSQTYDIAIAAEISDDEYEYESFYGRPLRPTNVTSGAYIVYPEPTALVNPQCMQNVPPVKKQKKQEPEKKEPKEAEHFKKQLSCIKNIPSSISKKRKRKRATSSKRRTRKKRERYACTICNKSMKFNALVYHYSRAHYIKRYTCMPCEKIYTQYKTLQNHISSVHEGVRHECHFCHKTFAYKDGLKIHQLSFHEPP